MADVKVSGLPSDSSLDGNHYTIVNDPTGPTTKRTLLSVLAGFFFNQVNIPDGSGSPRTRATENMYDYVASGLVWSGDAYASTRVASMTSGVVYINGRRLTISAVVSRTFTASKDTYIDILDNGDGTATIVYTEVANNAASPALAANSLRIGIIVTGASNIAAAGSVNQGQEDKLLPIVSSTPYAVTDSLGNLICPRDPQRKLIGYREYKTNQGSISTVVDLTGLTMVVNAPTARKIVLTLDMHMFSTVGGDFYDLSFKEGATTLRNYNGRFQTNSGQEHFYFEHEFTPTAGVHTYKVTLARASGSGGVGTFNSATLYSSFRVEMK